MQAWGNRPQAGEISPRGRDMGGQQCPTLAAIQQGIPGAGRLWVLVAPVSPPAAVACLPAGHVVGGGGSTLEHHTSRQALLDRAFSWQCSIQAS